MEILNEVNSKHLYSLRDTKLAYEYFLLHAFPIKEISLKLDTFFNSWMTKGLNKSFKRRQILYDKFLEGTVMQII